MQDTRASLLSAFQTEKANQISSLAFQFHANVVRLLVTCNLPNSVCACHCWCSVVMLSKTDLRSNDSSVRDKLEKDLFSTVTNSLSAAVWVFCSWIFGALRCGVHRILDYFTHVNSADWDKAVTEAATWYHWHCTAKPLASSPANPVLCSQSD